MGVQVPGQALESLELFAVPALPPCHRQVTFWPEHCSRQLALGHVVAPTATLLAWSELKALAGP